MTYILDDLSRQSLTFAIEENMYAFLPLFGRQPGAIFINTPEYKRSITSVPFGLFNSIMAAWLPKKRVDSVIQEIIADAQRRRIPLNWWTGPLTSPANLGDILEQHGFRVVDDHAPGMAVELAKLNEGIREPEGVAVRLCGEEDEKRLWSQVMGLGNEIPAEAGFVVESWADFLSGADTKVVQAYLAYLHGQPVATCLLLLGAGVAGIYAVATVPEARRRGIGAWVTLQALLQAREMGFRAGVLASSEMGLGVYRKLGFEEYCKISSYAWRP